MPFDIAALDEFAASFARVLFAEHPEWVEFARLEMDGETADLVMEVPSPGLEEGSRGLLIYTENSEVTVCFDHYHCHFDRPAGDEDSIANPLAFVDEILKENYAAASGWNGEKWAGSWIIRAGEPVEPMKKSSAMKRIRVRSWKGTRNQDVVVP